MTPGRPRGPAIAESHPSVAAKLLDPSDAYEFSMGTTTKLRFHCPVDQEHLWQVRPWSVKSGSGCSVCSNRVVQRGKNDLWTTRPDMASRLADPEVGYQVHAGSRSAVQWACPLDDRHLARPVPVVTMARDTTQCAVCSGKQVQIEVNDLWTTHPALASRLADPEVGRTISAGSNALVEWRCINDERHPNWAARTNGAREVTKSGGCLVCQGRIVIRGINDLWTTNPETARLLADPPVGYEVTAGSQRITQWVCLRDSRHRVRDTSVANRRKHGCGICGGHQIQPGINDLWTTDPLLAKQLVDEELGYLFGRHSDKPLQWVCRADPDHDHIWPATPATRTSGRGCIICAKTGFKTHRRALLYVLLAPSAVVPLIKFGVTNDPDSRLAKHRRAGFHEVLHLFELSGDEARKMEVSLKRYFRELGVPSCAALGMIFDGRTESHRLSDLPAAVLLGSIEALAASQGILLAPAPTDSLSKRRHAFRGASSAAA